MRLVLPMLVTFTLVLIGSPAAISDSSRQPLPTWRAFWVDAFNAGIRKPKEVDELIRDMKSLNMNLIIAQIRRRGDAYYRKTTEAPFTEDPAVPAGFDPLHDLLTKAHAEGIQVHAWINAMTLWRSQDGPPKAKSHPFNQHGPQAQGDECWLNCDERGNAKFPVGYFLDPGHPAVGEHLARVAAEIVRNYPVDGIHLDYIRYPETDESDKAPKRGVGYNAVSIRRFHEAHGTTGKPDHDWSLWQQWRRDQVSRVVRQIRAAMHKENPKVLLSAALIPWGDGPLTEAGWSKSAPYIRAFQDWHQWRQEGLLDVCVPMNYDREQNPQHKKFYDHWITFEKKHKYKSKLIIGIGAYLNNLDDTMAQTRRALEPVNGYHADGICYFSYASFKGKPNRPTMDELRQALTGESGLFAKTR
jgi:uncharacterized lipoprotein YddW (UPF0748 family)